MLCTFDYDPKKDVSPVDTFGYVDLIECFEKGEVPASISNTEDEYNGIDDPSTIIGKPRDSFEAIRMMDSIKKAGKSTTTATTTE